MRTPLNRQDTKIAKESRPIYPPNSLTKIQDEEGLHLIYERPRRKVLLGNFVLGLSFLICFIPYSFWSSLQTRRSGVWVATDIIFWGFGAVALYNFFMTTFNRTHIRINASQLTVRQKPFFEFGNRTIACGQIRQVFIILSKAGIGRSGNAPAQYHVRAVLQNHADLVLVGNLPEIREALYIEREIEHYLGIPETPALGGYEPNF